MGENDVDAVQPVFPALRRFGRLDAHHRTMLAALAAIVAGVLVPWTWHWPTRVLVTWDTFSLCTTALIWLTILGVDPREVARTASLQDTGRRAIFVFVVVAAVASVFAVGVELAAARGLDRRHLDGHVGFAVVTVVSSWFLVHTVFTLRYAHSFYGLGGGEEAKGSLNFPGDDRPDYLDFAYFSFVIGMTSQVSDVTIGSRPMRRLALVHGLIAFGFNAVIVGLGINIISGLLQ